MHGHLLAAGAPKARDRDGDRARLIPPTINYEVPDPECRLDYVPNVAARPHRRRLSTASAFGGHNMPVVCP